jgi:hypothetical protein
MSHNSIGMPPWVSAIAPAGFASPGAHNLILTGTNLSPSCILTLPAALGTVTGSPTFTALTSTTGQLSFPINVTAIPAYVTNRSFNLSLGGIKAVGIALTIPHGWTPSSLMVDPEDTWIQASDAAATGDGNRIASVTPSYGNRGDPNQPTGADRPYYFASTAELNGEPSIGMLDPQGGHAGELVATQNYIFNVSTTEFFVAMCWAPAHISGHPGGPMWIAFKNNGHSHSFAIHFDDTINKAYLWTGAANHGNWTYPNLNTTAPRRAMLYGGDGASVTFVEPVTGISQSVTPGTITPSTVLGLLIRPEMSHFAEMILITGRIPSAGERTALNDYWLNKYG